MHVAGIGRVVFWEGGSLWLALITGGNERHSHHAIQISLPLDGKVQFQLQPDGGWTSYAGVVIAPDLPHAFRAPGKVVANILFEPESVAGRAVLDRFGPGLSALKPAEAKELAAPLVAAYFDETNDAQLVARARQAIAEISGTALQATPPDQRILAAIAHIRAHIDEPIGLATLAGIVDLSPGRFRHLFVSETGISCKAFVLWERLNRALALGFGGTSWTEAAHAAGFADSAHLTRTCRRMFGMAPTGGRIEQPNSRRQMIA